MKECIPEIWSRMAELSDFKDVVSNWFEFGCFILTVFLIVYFFLFSTRKANSLSQTKIKELIKIRKYIPNLYVEIDDTLERLRFFIYNNLHLGFISAFAWRLRLLKEYYSTIGANFLLPYFSVFGLTNQLFLLKLDKKIRSIKYDDRNSDKRKYNPYFPNEECLKRNEHYWVCKKIQRVRKKLLASKSKSILVVGTAGNGKTNLLCRTAEILLRKNRKVIFINARDITENVYAYFGNQIGLPKFLVSKASCIFSVYLRLYHPFFIVDAINENDNKNFSKDFFASVDKMMAKGGRFIISSREEYFNDRFLTDIKEMNQKFYLLKIKSPRTPYSENTYLSRSQKIIISRYSKAFNVREPNEYIANQLFQSLLFLRLYFEVYKNSQDEILTLYKYKIYQRYVSDCVDKYDEEKRIRLQGMLEKIPSLMIKKGMYDSIFIDEIAENYDDRCLFRQFSDDNFLTSRKVVCGVNSIIQENKEIVYYPFDELRDYYLARTLIKGYQDSDIQSFIQTLSISKNSPFEGVVHYVYIHAKENKKDELIWYIISSIFTPVRHQINPEGYPDWGLDIIFDTGLPLTDSEKTYLKLCLLEKEQLLNVSFTLFHQEFYEQDYKLSDLMDLIYSFENIKDLKTALAPYCVNKYVNGDLFSGRNSQKTHWILIRLRACYQYKKCTSFMELLYISVLLFDGNDDVGFILEHYQERNFHLNEILAKTQCDELKKMVKSFLVNPSFDYTEDEFSQYLEDCLNDDES